MIDLQVRLVSLFQVKASGPGLKGGLVGNPAEFTIDTKGAGTGGLGLTVEGPTEAKIECSDNGDGTCSVSYLPTEPGDYLVNILFENVHIPGSPFRADIQMPFDPSKVVASGSGLKRAKVRLYRGRLKIISVFGNNAAFTLIIKLFLLSLRGIRLLRAIYSTKQYQYHFSETEK